MMQPVCPSDGGKSEDFGRPNLSSLQVILNKLKLLIQWCSHLPLWNPDSELSYKPNDDGRII